MGDMELEKSSLQHAIDIAPQFNQARYRLAVLLMKEKSFKKAEQELSAILNYAPVSEWGFRAKELLRTLPEP
jgi:Tfp pilus assembly protein PilF